MPATMTVDEVYSLMNYILNKNQQGNLPPSSFNQVINQAQFGYLNHLLGEFQKYMPGRPMSPVEFGGSAQIRQRLTPFIQQPTTLAINAITGFTPYPPDYEMWDAMYWGIYRERVKYIQQDRLGVHLKSQISPVTRNPVFLSIYTGFEVYPHTIGTTELSYIRTPPNIAWNFTNDIYGRPVYSPATSVNPGWDKIDMMEIISRALAMTGVNLQSQAVEQYSQMIKNAGQ